MVDYADTEQAVPFGDGLMLVSKREYQLLTDLKRRYMDDVRELEGKLEALECAECGKNMLQCECEQ